VSATGPAALRLAARTAREYARALLAHQGHATYRCDVPRDGLMGRGCRACGVETVIAIGDFRATGDLQAFAEELEAGRPKERR
jgi:hypothetical protein